jgi:hypothetical protein
MQTCRRIAMKTGALILLLVSTQPGRAQSCQDYLPIREGTTLSYVTYDGKDKMTGRSVTTFKEKKGTPEGFIAVFASTLKDDKGEARHTSEFKVECRNDTLSIDYITMLDPATLSSFESMDVKLRGKNLVLPMDAVPGDLLEDGDLGVEISSGGVKIMAISVHVTHRKVIGWETVDTPAGSIECIKYSSDVISQIGSVKMNVSGVDWYSYEYGSVRSESYDRKGKLTGYTLLESISD